MSARPEASFPIYLTSSSQDPPVKEVVTEQKKAVQGTAKGAARLLLLSCDFAGWEENRDKNAWIPRTFPLGLKPMHVMD